MRATWKSISVIRCTKRRDRSRVADKASVLPRGHLPRAAFVSEAVYHMKDGETRCYFICFSPSGADAALCQFREVDCSQLLRLDRSAGR